MKTTIRADGTLVVEPESGLEAFALNYWAKNNINNDWYDVRCQRPKLIINLSAYADQLGSTISMPLAPGVRS